MDQTSSSTTLSHDSTLHPPSDDSGGKSTPIRTPSRSSSSFDDDRSSPLQLDDLSKLRKPPQAHREEPRRVPGSRGVGERDDSDDNDDDSDNAEDDALVLEQDPAEMSSWSGQPSIRGSSEAMRMILLTFNTLGITFTWGIEMTYCTPYLLNLGLSKSNTSLVWVAGPLSGLVVQPIVGAIADESKSKWGRRRPFIVLGSIITAFALAILGFTKEIVGIFISEKETARIFTIILAVLAIYVVDFAINAVMSCARSLIVDTLPIEKQQTGAAWSSRMSAIGHMLGYIAGAVDLVGIFGTWLGDSQFQILTVIATFMMLFSSAVTCWAVTERVLVSTRQDPRQATGKFKVFRQIWSTLLHLPPRIQAICWAQFWSWIGWFPFLFYSTTWVGETYFRYDAAADGKDSKDALGDIGRIGSMALVIYSTITFIGAWLLPLIVKSPDDDNFTARPPRAIAPFLEKFSKKKPDLMTAWIFGHLMFAAAMSLAPFATSFRFATFLVAACGFSWTIAMWAPSAFLGVEVNKLSGGGSSSGGAAYRRLSDASNIELPTLGQDQPLHLEHGPDENTQPSSSTGELSGIYFGILNIYTTLPQFIGTFISSIVFSILEPGKSPELSDAPEEEHHNTDGPNAIAVCLFIGAMCAVVAAFATRKLKHL
ncbi:General alpha-glucoside permease [Colletotrichum sp. SAR 10_70]|uniref:General alpha-glucoside permease n=1 Tax=Colletotrichum siamense TaxID=690259 RepID=UPI0018729099|nr:General alpha-glucoside permease [Colletotrichum siamense]KAF5517140.1 General alpha-glucoside permease [Colletotrichum siamense]KAI8158236.1 General alpha-glucoside permease [Colletotrichum sp. SAR 10_71]KAI8195021.1 General alpha-glucoside permease [Colletotrichum sp. SAR 10_70]